MLTSLARAKTAAQSARLGWLITAVRRPTRPQGRGFWADVSVVWMKGVCITPRSRRPWVDAVTIRSPTSAKAPRKRSYLNYVSVGDRQLSFDPRGSRNHLWPTAHNGSSMAG